MVNTQCGSSQHVGEQSAPSACRTVTQIATIRSHVSAAQRGSRLRVAVPELGRAGLIPVAPVRIIQSELAT